MLKGSSSTKLLDDEVVGGIIMGIFGLKFSSMFENLNSKVKVMLARDKGD